MKVFFITYKRLGSVMEGGGQGALKNYSALCSIFGTENVTFYCVHDDDRHRSLSSYVGGILYTPMGYYFGLSPKRVEEIVKIAFQYDYVFIDRSLFSIIAKKLKEHKYRGIIITYYHNIESVYLDSKLSRRLPFRNVLIRCADRNDLWGCQYSDYVVALNERDDAELGKRYGRHADTLIPVTLNDKLVHNVKSKDLTSQRPTCLTIGAYFAPNNEGILWFVRSVLPYVDVDYKIIGKGMIRLKEEHEELRDIEVLSDVADLAPYYEGADILILPIFSGSGMKVKTCESLMYGKNILATDEALEGYAIEEGVSAWRCNTAEEFILRINDFSQHPHPRFNQAARNCYLENYSSTMVEKKYKELLGV